MSRHTFIPSHPKGQRRKKHKEKQTIKRKDLDHPRNATEQKSNLRLKASARNFRRTVGRLKKRITRKVQRLRVLELFTVVIVFSSSLNSVTRATGTTPPQKTLSRDVDLEEISIFPPFSRHLSIHEWQDEF